MISGIVSGNIGSDAVTRAAGKTTVTSFSIASNAYRNKEKVVDWVRCSMFGARAEKLAQYLVKGQYVVVSGEICMREFEHKGEKKISLEITAKDIELGGGKKDGGGQAKPQRRDDSPPADDYSGGADSDIPF